MIAANAQLLTLDDVVREVQLHNPALTSAHRAVEARKLAVGVAGALPDPTVTVAYMGSAAPFKTMENDPSSYRGLSAMQMLPLGGKRELRREMARKEVNATEADQLAVARRLTAEAKSAYYDYFYYDKALSIKPGYPDALEYRGEAYLGLARIADAQQAYLDLYAGNRALAGKLLSAMKSWATAQRASSPLSGQIVVRAGNAYRSRAALSSETVSKASMPPTPAYGAPAAVVAKGTRSNV